MKKRIKKRAEQTRAKLAEAVETVASEEGRARLAEMDGQAIKDAVVEGTGVVRADGHVSKLGAARAVINPLKAAKRAAQSAGDDISRQLQRDENTSPGDGDTQTQET